MEHRIFPRPIATVISPDNYPRRNFTDPVEAVKALRELYDRNTAFLRQSFLALAEGGKEHVRYRAYYPEIGISTASYAHIDTRISYGHVPAPGHYSTPITRPDLFENYLIDQLGHLIRNHGVPVTVSESGTPIPLHFAFGEGAYVEGSVAESIKRPLRDVFDVPDLNSTDDHIANGTFEPIPGEPLPLAPFTAQRIDYSLHRLSHYTATSPHHFQNFVLFTNYQFYIDEFCVYARELMADGGNGYTAFVEPGNLITPAGETSPQEGATPPRLPQMPTYHLIKP